MCVILRVCGGGGGGWFLEVLVTSNLLLLPPPPSSSPSPSPPSLLSTLLSDQSPSTYVATNLLTPLTVTVSHSPTSESAQKQNRKCFISRHSLQPRG